MQTLRHYGMERLYEQRLADPVQRREAMARGARFWAERFDPNSMVVLADAAAGFDVRPRLPDLRARLLLMQCTTDNIFPPDDDARARLARLQEQGVPTRFVALESPYGHMAPGVECPRLEEPIRWLLNREPEPETAP